MIAAVWLLCFPLGERLVYDARYSFLNLGTMTLEVRDTITYEGTDCYIISSVLNSAGGLRFLFSIDDTVFVCTSADSLLPYWYKEKINESGYRRESLLNFDRTVCKVNYDDSVKYDIGEDTRDLLSFWYYLRLIPLEIGDTLILDIHSARENHLIKCPIEREEKVRTPAGEYRTILVRAETEGKGVFGAKGGMAIWYSEAERIPVQIKANMKFGGVLFRLKEVIN